MLVHLLALAVGLSSFALYMAAFFFPEVHRKNDLIWSGIGMFYALVLWFCAGQIRGALLLGQTASVSLLLWLGWQTLRLRRTTTPLDQQTLPMASPQELTQHTLEQAKSAARNFSFSESVTAVVGTVSSAVDAFKQKSPPKKSTPPAPPAVIQGATQPPAAATVTDTQDRVAPLYEDPSEVAQAETPARETTAPDLPIVEPQPDSEMGAPAIAEEDEIPIAEYVEIPRPQPTPTPSTPTPSRQPKTVTQGTNKLVVLKDWLVDVVSSFRKPKPSRPMVEIPPREPSIPATAAVNQPSTLEESPQPAATTSTESQSEMMAEADDDWEFDDLEAAPEETTLVEVAADQPEATPDTSPEAIADAAAEIIQEENEALPNPEGFEPAANDLEVDAEEESPSEAEVTEPVEEVPEGPIPTASDETPAEEAKAEEDSLTETEVTEPVEEVPEGPIPTVSDEPPADDADDDDNDDDGIPEDLTNTVSPLIGENLSEEELSELEEGEQPEAQTEPDAIAPEASFEVADPPESEVANPEAEVEAADAPANLADVPTPPDLADLSPEPQPPVEEPVEIAPEVLADLSPDVETETVEDTDDPRLRRPNPPSPDLIKAAQAKDDDPEEGDRDAEEDWI